MARCDRRQHDLEFLLRSEKLGTILIVIEQLESFLRKKGAEMNKLFN